MSYNINGFEFTSETEYNEAKKEADSIAYIKSKAKLTDPQVALQVYTKLYNGSNFHTIVGLTFLSRLRDIILSSKIISEEELPNICYSITVESSMPNSVTEYNNQQYEAKLTKLNNLNTFYKSKLKKCYIVIGALILIVAILFGISFYYRAPSNVDEIALQNKYSEWAESLNERERRINYYGETEDFNR